MKFSVLAVAFMLAAVLVQADPRTLAGKAGGPQIAVISGSEGSVVLSHGTSVVKEVPWAAAYTAVIVLAGPEDSVSWNGEAGSLQSAGKNPAASAAQALEGRSAPYLFWVAADGTLNVVKAPDPDAVAAASAAE